MYAKALVIALIFFGELFAIGAELWMSKYVQTGERWLQAFTFLMIPMAVGGALLLLGYMYGYAYLRDIWLIAAVSVSSIVLVEPILIYILFQEVPGVGAATGFVLGLLGLLAVLVLP